MTPSAFMTLSVNTLQDHIDDASSPPRSFPPQCSSSSSSSTPSTFSLSPPCSTLSTNSSRESVSQECEETDRPQSMRQRSKSPKDGPGKPRSPHTPRLQFPFLHHHRTSQAGDTLAPHHHLSKPKVPEEATSAPSSSALGRRKESSSEQKTTGATSRRGSRELKGTRSLGSRILDSDGAGSTGTVLSCSHDRQCTCREACARPAEISRQPDETQQRLGQPSAHQHAPALVLPLGKSLSAVSDASLCSASLCGVLRSYREVWSPSGTIPLFSLEPLEGTEERSDVKKPVGVAAHRKGARNAPMASTVAAKYPPLSASPPALHESAPIASSVAEQYLPRLDVPFASTESERGTTGALPLPASVQPGTRPALPSQPIVNEGVTVPPLGTSAPSTPSPVNVSPRGLVLRKGFLASPNGLVAPVTFTLPPPPLAESVTVVEAPFLFRKLKRTSVHKPHFALLQKKCSKQQE